MSMFTRGFYEPDPSFTPLFRLLDDFDSYREAKGSQEVGSSTQRRLRAATFIPKFDLRETKEAYQLHGELPGIDKEHVSIEFTDPQTIVIRGHVERRYTAGTPPDDFKEAITEKGEDHHRALKASVEDEAVAEAKEKNANGNGNGNNDGTQMVRHKQDKEKPKTPAEKYWVSERSIGDFSRTFGFPSRVDQEGVTASLTNGILNITVPKARKMEARRIAIN
ncbi:HSP20-like chaperone [Apodospora peruviana]|uniref:HSP20-like chaperone n=1 Tax=Apodospora peruviana TaxID=516989 RepID=A0AAE0MGM5_9PEZI|nr:HSP20-like chaperone [Apodospora peruviana]